MILVTTGTNEQPFDRLVRAAATLGGEEELVVQYGASRVEHGRGQWLDFVGFDELVELMTRARVIVGHAGAGSIMLARRCGICPIVVPRRHDLNEAVDDHQLPLARRLHAAGIVTLLEDERLLGALLSETPSAGVRRADEDLPGASALAADVRTRLLSARVAAA